MIFSASPKISVIVPVYMVEKYLNRCVVSILEQTYNDFELILVDDGSPDGCGEICDKYAKEDKRVKVIHKQNGGLSEARNFGLDRSSGAYITFVDSDDWIEKEYLEVLYQNIINNNADISVVNLHKEYDGRREDPSEISTGLYSGIDSMRFFYDINMATCANVACAKLYKRELFEKIRYPVGRLYEDAFTTYKLFCSAEKVYFSNADLYCYYQRCGSIMNNSFSIKNFDEYNIFLERIEFLKEKGLHELLVQNEKARWSAIKTLTLKTLDSQLSNVHKRTYLKLFKRDVRKNYKLMFADESKVHKLSGIIYIFSCRLFKIVSIIFHSVKHE